MLGNQPLSHGELFRLFMLWGSCLTRLIVQGEKLDRIMSLRTVSYLLPHSLGKAVLIDLAPLPHIKRILRLLSL